MSPNTPPNPPDDASIYGTAHEAASQNASDEHAGRSNPYSTRYHEAVAPDLDANAPQLQSADMQRMNRRAMFFLIAIVVLLVISATWLLNSVEGRKNQAPKQRDETITVPDAPKAAPPRDIAPMQKPTPPIPMMATSSPRNIDSRTPMPPSPAPPTGPNLLERRMMSGNLNGQGGAQGQEEVAQATAAQAKSVATSAQPLNNPDTLMLRGTYIRCVLETRIISDIPGYTSCIVTEPVYSFNGRKLLLPKGSKVLGSYQGMPTGKRIAVIWDRIVTPTGIDVNMSSPGVDNLGGAGQSGYYNAHWGSRIGSALLISMLSDAFKYEAAEHGPSQTTITNGVVQQTPFESNTAQTVQSLANQAVQSAANRPATVTVNQGTVVNVYVSKDVDFSGVVARF